MRALEKQLRKEKVKRIDTAVVTENAGAAGSMRGWSTGRWGEERIAKVV